jgi:hypothetical protein
MTRNYWLIWGIKLGFLSIPLYFLGFIFAFYTIFVRTRFVEIYFLILTWPAKAFGMYYYPLSTDINFILVNALGWGIIGAIAGFVHKIILKRAKM